MPVELSANLDAGGVCALIVPIEDRPSRRLYPMATQETHGLGYKRVDDDPNVAVLLATMDAMAGLEATQWLRAWERDQLRLVAGQRLLDVGCGLGDAVLALGEAVGDDGEVVGIDASSEMVTVAQKRASAARCHVRFAVGNALALDEPDGYFDVVRSERTLQWLTDPQAAVLEMARTLRAGGVLSLIDSDWSTLVLDVDDDDLARRVRDGMHAERGRPSNIGRRLAELVQAVGFDVFAETTATHTWNRWDPDQSPAPDGCFSMSSLADDLVDTGQLQPVERERFVSTIHQAARDGRFSMALTMFAVVAGAPTAVD
jgi:SAM-dependent methyltransferase